MPFLAVNGVTFPASSYAEKIREVGGEIVVSSNGLGLKNTYGIAAKSDIEVQSSPMLAADAAAWVRAINGDGEVWSFGTSAAGSFYGSRGSPPATTAGLTTSTLAFGAVGGRKLVIASGANYFDVPLPFTTFWTALLLRGITGSPVDHYIVTSGGHKWLNSVRADGTSTTWLSAIAGASEWLNRMRVNGDAVDSISVDELVVLPYVIPDSWGPSLANYINVTSGSFPPLPRLAVYGDAFGTGSVVPRYFFGSVSDNKPLTKSGSYRQLSISLMEVT